MKTLIDTYENNGWSYADYLESCEDNGIEPQGEDSEHFFDWVRDRINMDEEDFFDGLKYSRICRQPVTVSGSLGLWWGRPSIQPRKFDDLSAAILACLQDSYYFSVKMDRGVLKVAASHHDGTNNFEIRRASGRFWPAEIF